MDAQAAVTRDAVGLDDPLVALTLGSIYAAAPTPPPKPRRPSPPTPPPSQPASATRRRLNDSAPVQRRRPRNEPPSDDDAAAADGAPPPFPWATERPARHDTLDSLLRRGVTSVEGEARCKRCSRTVTVAYELAPKFREVREFVVANRHAFDDRAPDAWMYPVLPDCAACGEKRCVWPWIADDKGEINWLFLLLGQMLGCCTLEQLKYFCKNTGRHRTGAKNRVLYYAFLEMCRQLEPRGPFDDTVADGNGFLHS
ncbi:hypothetical protein CFC21_078431 [Triticum aestivum]|uniref:DUF7086 domain-containing protein n=4 Tax=Triticinae TaxID=1648030 RepID=A0A9R1G017_WHEAT|nr:uncharacterized protein LOC109732394 [Aegilops tauschii subsp. strangulata]XP_044357507.1 uncharacterized protein LOC123078921 [Triticum aestivum]KAF7037352.1 hypothetical protein CFC21_047744 [Triticum aestivum]KAF7073453.1 hypothetical protein CFC21_078431 [Triticum aestivum]